MEISISDFEILDSVGAGSFSSVSHAVYKPSGKHVALKRLFWNNSPQRIVKEIKWLRNLHHPNITKILGIFRDKDQVTIIFDYFDHKPFRTLLFMLNNNLIKGYMRSLLHALVYIHKLKIIHRDVKPANFLFNPEKRTGCLIDFGLCEDDLHIETSSKNKNYICDTNDLDLKFPKRFQNRPRMIANRAGTRGFRAPEVLLSAWNQSSAIDIWSTGVILLSIVSRRYPFFRAPDDLTALCEIAKIFGTKKIYETAIECRRKVIFPNEAEPLDLKELCFALNPSIEEMELEDSIFDLLEKLLEPIPSKRITAEDALQHPFLQENL